MCPYLSGESWELVPTELPSHSRSSAKRILVIGSIQMIQAAKGRRKHKKSSGEMEFYVYCENALVHVLSKLSIKAANKVLW